MAYKYAFKDYDAESMARNVLINASVSTKHCIEICNTIRGKKVERARHILGDAIEMKQAIPFRRFNLGVGHRRGIGPGRYPVNACTEMLKALDNCEANAQQKGLNTSELIIRHISANLASRPWHYGRARRRKMKRTHLEIVLEELEPAPKKSEKKGAKTKDTADKADAEKKTEKTEVKTEKPESKPVVAEKPNADAKKEAKPVKKEQPELNAESQPKSEAKIEQPEKPTVVKERKPEPVKKEPNAEKPVDDKPDIKTEPVAEKPASPEQETEQPAQAEKTEGVKNEPKKDSVSKDK